jgi:hypothetical protein
VSASVQVANPAFDQFIDVGCRSSGEGSQYRLMLYPAAGTFQLARSIDGRVATLTGVRQSPLIHAGSASNAVELSCQGPRIAASINGERAAQVTDYSFTSGAALIGAGQSAAHVDRAARTPPGATIQAEFSNVVVR